MAFLACRALSLLRGLIAWIDVALDGFLILSLLLIKIKLIIYCNHITVIGQTISSMAYSMRGCTVFFIYILHTFFVSHSY